LIKVLYNPMDDVFKAIHDLYPNIEAELVFHPGWEDHFGETIFHDDGSVPMIQISGQMPFEAVLEIIAHEAAHVIAGEGHGHDEILDKHFERINARYLEIVMAQ
jgi:hypothetical protein